MLVGLHAYYIILGFPQTLSVYARYLRLLRALLSWYTTVPVKVHSIKIWVVLGAWLSMNCRQGNHTTGVGMYRISCSSCNSLADKPVPTKMLQSVLHVLYMMCSFHSDELSMAKVASPSP
jgi:hypothetical protein